MDASRATGRPAPEWLEQKSPKCMNGREAPQSNAGCEAKQALRAEGLFDQVAVKWVHTMHWFDCF